MKRRAVLAAFPFVLAAAMPARAAEPKATPTPSPAPVLTTHPTPAARSAGSLADTVRRTKASATPVPKKKSLGSITNESLKTKSEGTGKGSVQMGPAHPIADLPPAGAHSSGGAGSEQEWRQRATQGRERIETAEGDVKRLEQESKRLENDFYAWSDGNYRDRVIKPAWDQARDDLKKARTELDTAQNAMADLEDEARKSGAPPGWLRP